MPRRKAYDTRFSVRVTQAELAALKAQAARHRRSLSRYLVEQGLQGSPAMSPEQRQAHEQLMVQLRKVGANLNQIAARLNSGYGVASGRLSEALAAVREATTHIEQVTQR